MRAAPNEAQAPAADHAEPGFVELTRGRLLARNGVWNLAGLGLPAVAALVALPALLRGLGEERFGILAISWTVVGYFSLFDFGIGRALTTRISAELGVGRPERGAGIAWTGLVLMGGLGLLGTLAVLAATPLLLTRVLHVPAELHDESRAAFLLMAATLPFVITTAGTRGILEAHQRFDLVNAVRVPLGLLNFLGPLAMLPFSTSLAALVAVLAAGRVLAWGASAVLAKRVMPSLGGRPRLVRAEVGPLLRIGGWMTVTNTVGPIIVYADRFLIAGLVSTAAITWYVTPFEVIGRLLIITTAIASVLFPAFAASFRGDRALTARRYDQGLRATAALLFPVCLAVACIGPWALAHWVGEDLARASGRVARLLAVGVFANAMGQVPFTLVQATGRPDLSAKLHLAELPLYVALLAWLTRTYGVEGAALAFALRALVDTLCLMAIARRLVPEIGAAFPRWAAATVLGVVLSGLSLLLPSGVPA